MEERIELRCVDGPLLGVLITGPMRLQVKRGQRMFEVDLLETLRTQEAVVLETVLGTLEGAAESSARRSVEGSGTIAVQLKI